MKKKVAIVGGGVAGLYAAWRLLKRGDDAFDVTVYEADPDRVGGRINTMTFGIRKKGSSEPPEELSAELGAMRFPNTHRLLLNLCNTLGIKDVDKSAMPAAWRGPFELPSLFHLRGTTLSPESFHGRDIPYRVRPDEQGKTPEMLLQYAIHQMLDKMVEEYARSAAGGTSEAQGDLAFLRRFRQQVRDHEAVPASVWMEFMTRDYKFAGIPLRNIGLWNVLKHFLSSEAFLLVHDGFGFLSVISNWSAPQAFKWLLTDFAPHQRLHTVPRGMTQVVNALADEIGRRVIRKGAPVEAIDWNGSRFLLHLGEGGPEEADSVILALPPNALRRIRMFPGCLKGRQQANWKKLIACSRPHRLAKIVLAYDEPWWKHTGIPGADSGRVFTDLPMRQIYYFGPRWLAENRWTKPGSNRALVMVYNDSHYEAFWRTFHVHDRVYRKIENDRDAEHPDATMGWRLDKLSANGLTFWGPQKMHRFATLIEEQRSSAATLVSFDDEPEEFDADEVRHRMEEKVRAQLSELHGYEVPVALGGVYKDWSDDGGWHTWEPFVDVPAVKEVLRQPFDVRDGAIAVRPCGVADDGSSRLSLFVCGEAYAWEQGWIEGALMTAEAVTAAIAGSTDCCDLPSWFKDGKDAYERYMMAEFSAAKRDALSEQYAQEERKRASGSQ